MLDYLTFEKILLNALQQNEHAVFYYYFDMVKASNLAVLRVNLAPTELGLQLAF